MVIVTPVKFVTTIERKHKPRVIVTPRILIPKLGKETNNVHMNKRPTQRGSHDYKNRGQGHKFDKVDETPNLVGFPHAS